MNPKTDDWKARTESLIGAGADKLKNARVLVVGAGGVGGYCLEMLVRAGVGHIVVMDDDAVDVTNINRQILADRSTVGLPKTEVAVRRARDIAAETEVDGRPVRFNARTVSVLDEGFDYVADAIDSVADKVLLITACKQRGLPVISAMGAGNRLDDDFVVTDLYRTENDGLARVLRRRLKAEGVTELTVVASPAVPHKTDGAPASISYPPAVAGCKMAGKIARDLLQ